MNFHLVWSEIHSVKGGPCHFDGFWLIPVLQLVLPLQGALPYRLRGLGLTLHLGTHHLSLRSTLFNEDLQRERGFVAPIYCFLTEFGRAFWGPIKKRGLPISSVNRIVWDRWWWRKRFERKKSPNGSGPYFPLLGPWRLGWNQTSTKFKMTRKWLAFSFTSKARYR